MQNAGGSRKRRRTQVARQETPQNMPGPSSASPEPTLESNVSRDPVISEVEVVTLVPETLAADSENWLVPIRLSPLTTENSKRGTTPEELNQLLEHSENVILIVDCRDLKKFLKGKVKFSKCINIPIKSTVKEASDGLNSKLSVVQFLQKHYPKLLAYMYGPGFYDNIVLYDDASTCETIPKPIKAVMEALIKWNETKKTKVSILEGGIQAWTKKFPYALKCDENQLAVHGHGLNESVQVQVSQEEFALRNFHITPVFDKDLRPSAEHLKLHLKNLEMAITTTTSVINLRGNWKSFLAVKLALTDESEGELNLGFESQVPADVKCPVCMEVFDGEIFQCGNGHSICARCCELLNACPKCRMSYKKGAAKIRNRSLENLMATTLKVDCQSCERSLYYKEVQNHVKNCPAKKMPEVAIIVKELAKLEDQIKTMSEKLEVMNQYILDTEHFWNTWLDRDHEIGKRSSNIDFESILVEMLAKKVTLGTLNATLLSAVFLKSENKMKTCPPTFELDYVLERTPGSYYYYVAKLEKL